MKINQRFQDFDKSGAKVYIPTEKYDIDLSLTQNPLGCSPKVLEIIRQHISQINHYPDPFYRELSSFLSKKHGIPNSQYIFGAGVDGLIENIVRILINPGDEIIMPQLTFINTSFAASIAGGKTIFTKMKPNFHIDFSDIHHHLSDHTKMVFICNPNNPTGLIEDQNDMIELVETADCLVVIDEANIEFSGKSMIKFVKKYHNLVVLRTFSKGYSLAGMRIGYCVGNEQLMNYVWRIRPPFPNTLLAQEAALAALQDEDHLEKSRQYMKSGRDYLTQELEQLGFEVIPSESNCFLVKVTPHFSSSTKFNDLLHQHNTTVVDGKHYHGLGDSYIRIAPQLHETNHKFIEIVKKLMKNKS